MPDFDLTDPAVFARKFFEVATTGPDGHRSDDYTRWFGDCMKQLARRGEMHVQNRHLDVHPGEWLAVDHVFVRKNAYDHFPLVVVEHENGDLCKSSKDGELPKGYDQSARIEWALWKALAVRSHLAVLVAYPYGDHDRAVRQVFRAMLQGYRREFNCPTPKVLFLLGWWPDEMAAKPQPWNARDVYTPYTANENCELTELKI